MNKVVKWLNANKLSINASKTKFVIFRSKNKSLSNTEITVKEVLLYVCVYLCVPILQTGTPGLVGK